MVLLSAFAIAGVGAVSVSASGHEFVVSKTGKTKSKGTSVGQVFKTGAGTIECTSVTGTGEMTELKSVTHKEVLTYSNCSGFGMGIKVTPAHFEFNANGSARLEKTVFVTPEGAGCEVLIEPQTLEAMTYSNSSGKVTAEAAVMNIRSRGTGGSCGGENTEGSYSGKIQGEVEGGTAEWK
ncbi:MAG TPA: hypothetical protein VK790_15300 [Solirubrobacteraceae bacterium]|nr:hypothetical protein [Solirubrobacteraceae bacterium]